MKIGEKPIRGEIFIEGKKHRSNQHSFFFFFLSYFTVALTPIIDTTALSISRNGDKKLAMPFPGTRFFSHFSRGEMERFADSGQLRCFVGGKKRKRKMIFRV